MTSAPLDLDADACYRAVRSRDRRFEGRFVLAVTSTGIYCRPGCPARIPARRNVRFLPGPAAAEVAGFRPCRRCRPDASPDSPAWSGTAATVTRALRLIDEGALDQGGVEALAARLGMSGRHLRRLFLERLGATPKAVALSRRAHFARKLIEETGLSLAAIAHASGFGSVRRFNGVVRRTFRCAPGELRRGAPGRGAGVELRLPYRPPLDWKALLEFLAVRAIPGVEKVEGDRYRRTIRIDSAPGILEVLPAPGGGALLLRVGAPQPGAGLDRIVRRVRRLFDLDADPLRIGRDLARDPFLASRVRAHPGLRVPGAWDPFETTVRAILGQQVSVRGATTLAGRLVSVLGEPFGPAAEEGLTHLFPAPADVARADLSRLGLPEARRRCLATVARAASSGSLPLDGSAPLEEVVERLTALPGVGPWTAQYVAMRALAEPDAFPEGDLGLKRATGLDGAALLERAERWRPWRAYATMHLWRGPARVAGKDGRSRGGRRR